MRIERIENRRWSFTYGEVTEAVAVDWDDSAWFDVGLPHSFGAPADLDPSFYVGHGTYRHHFAVDEAWAGRTLEFEFGAVFQHCRVFVNGVQVGAHRGGYSAFTVDVTRDVRPGDNVLTVLVDNLWDPALAPRAGEHSFNGGIYRDVVLRVLDPVHVAWYGTGIVTASLSADRASVEVTTEVENSGAETAAEVVVENVVGLRGVQVARSEVRAVVTGGGGRELRSTLQILRPELWSPESPVLYDLTTTIRRQDGEIADRVHEQFGVRTIAFDAETGFHLNGEHYWLDGANAHQDHAGWGDGVTRAAMGRDVALVKAAGMNFLRGSHYPHHAHFAVECDRQGMLFWAEAPFWGTGGETSEGFWTASAYPVDPADEAGFEQSCLDAITDMIRINRNRPSVLAWSVSNEPFFSDSSVMDKARSLVTKMVDHARRLDPTRPAAVGGAQRGQFDHLGDLAGYNGDGAALFLDPGVPNLVSEYGSTVEDRPGAYTHRYTDGVEHRLPWRSGIALWCAFHHQSIFRGMGRMGFIDHSRLPLRSWHWYRQERLGIEPPAPAVDADPVALRLTSDVTRFTTDGTEDAFLTVELVDGDGHVVDRDPAVTLCVLEGDGRFASGRSIRFTADDGTIIAGAAATELRAYYAGPVVVEASCPGLEPVTVTLIAEGDEPWAGQELRLQEGPPTRDGVAPTSSTTNIAHRRPVFADSHGPLAPPSLVTDSGTPTGWRALDLLPGHWIRVDLEGPRHLIEVVVRAAYTTAQYRVSVSVDGRSFAEIGRSTPSSADPYRIDLDQDVRFIQLDFPGEPVEVHLIEAYEADQAAIVDGA